MNFLSKVLCLSALAVACGTAYTAQADSLEVQLTPDKVVQLIPIAPDRIQPSPSAADWPTNWDDWWCQWYPEWCPQPDPEPDPEPQPDPNAERDYRGGISKLPNDLGMNAVPVLDQGQYGTCVTFAATAALDALIAKGDFVSQQCSLELNKGLGNDLWNGAYYPSEIIDPMKQYGVVSQAKCPDKYPNPNASMTSAKYTSLSDPQASKFVKSVNLVYKSTKDLQAVKAALKAGHRVMIGFLVQNVSEAVRGFDIKYDGKSYQGGLWACKQGNSQNYCGTSQAGHEVVIVGYDDAQKLLKIRNSWGPTVGAQGDYFMSYEFFGKMVIDQTEIW